MLALRCRGQAACRSSVVSHAHPVKTVVNSLQQVKNSPVFKTTGTIAVVNTIMASPAYAEAGKLFDFNLTLPIMAGQFLLLMVFLDKTWFTPVGKVLEERDEMIRKKLESVQDSSSEIAEMQAEAERILKEARDAAARAVAEARAQTKAEQDARIKAIREQLDRDLEKALAELEAERVKAAETIESQAEELSNDIVSQVCSERALKIGEGAVV